MVDKIVLPLKNIFLLKIIVRSCMRHEFIV